MYSFPFPAVSDLLESRPTAILLESIKYNRENFLSYVFVDPLRIIQCHKPEQLLSCLDQLQQEQASGLYAAGFISYEAGYALLEKLPTRKYYDFPLLWMGIFDAPFIFDHRRNRFRGKTPPPPRTGTGDCRLSRLRLSLPQTQYCRTFRKIQRFIEAGDTYQVNYTMKYRFQFQGSLPALYRGLRAKQPVSYGALIKTPGFGILSFSPELFFRQHGRVITVRPMKGTAFRGTSPREDARIKKTLRRDPKNRAENLMIVDLLRNDLGKISRTGSVKVTDLFRVEQYPSLFQMTSTIRSRINNNLPLAELFAGLFPSGSVTGAPKIRTMQIIHTLEPEPRRIYTGAIGLLLPRRDAVFSIAIRTLLLRGHRGELGIGSGITCASAAEQEYAECLLKARFLTDPDFRLIETMRWTYPAGIILLALHLQRLQRSARFFSFPFSRRVILARLRETISGLDPSSDYKIRLLLSTDGKVSLKATSLPHSPAPVGARIILSPHRTQSNDIFLRHKTTRRYLYDREHEKYLRRGFFDVLFRNEHNAITEGAISNIVIRQGDYFFTPPISCGVLPGVYREHLLQIWPGKIREKILRIEDLKTAQALYCVNAVRGMVPVTLFQPRLPGS